MEFSLSEITNQALSLPIDDRVALAQRLWDSIEGFSDPGTEDAWLKKAEKRWQEIEEGKVECIPAEEAMKRAKNSLTY